MRREKGKRKIKRGIYILPSIFTSLSLFCGFYSITASIKEGFLYASWAIILAAAFDAVDGRIARLIHSVSSFGKQYDSLVDVISFGIAPGIPVCSPSARKSLLPFILKRLYPNILSNTPVIRGG